MGADFAIYSKIINGGVNDTYLGLWFFFFFFGVELVYVPSQIKQQTKTDLDFFSDNDMLH